MSDSVGSLFGQLVLRLNKLNLSQNPNVMRKTVNDALKDAGMPPLSDKVALSKMSPAQYKAVLEHLPPITSDVGGAA